MVVKPQSRGPRKQGIVNDGEKRLQFGLQLCPRCDFGGSGVQKATKVFEIAVVKGIEFCHQQWTDKDQNGRSR